MNLLQNTLTKYFYEKKQHILTKYLDHTLFTYLKQIFFETFCRDERESKTTRIPEMEERKSERTLQRRKRESESWREKARRIEWEGEGFTACLFRQQKGNFGNATFPE